MEKVAGIGGLFFRAHDPDALGHWYLQHLGIALTPTTQDSPVWQQEAGFPVAGRRTSRHEKQIPRALGMTVAPVASLKLLITGYY